MVPVKTASRPAILAPLSDRKVMRKPSVENPKACVTKLPEVNIRCSRVLFIWNASFRRLPLFEPKGDYVKLVSW
jgi:hypothetical protein